MIVYIHTLGSGSRGGEQMWSCYSRANHSNMVRMWTLCMAYFLPHVANCFMKALNWRASGSSLFPLLAAAQLCCEQSANSQRLPWLLCYCGKGYIIPSPPSWLFLSQYHLTGPNNVRSLMGGVIPVHSLSHDSSMSGKSLAML